MKQSSIFLIFILFPGITFSQIFFPETTENSDEPEIQVRLLENPVSISTQVPSKPVVVKFANLLSLGQETHEITVLLELLSESTRLFPNFPFSVFGNARHLSSLPSVNSSTAKYRIKATFGCEMHFNLYPFDAHLCTVTLRTDVVPLFCGGLKANEFGVKGYLQLPSGTLPGVQRNASAQQGVKFQTILLLIERTSGMQIFSQMYSPALTLALLSFFTMFSAMSHTIRIATSLALVIVHNKK